MYFYLAIDEAEPVDTELVQHTFLYSADNNMIAEHNTIVIDDCFWHRGYKITQKLACATISTHISWNSRQLMKCLGPRHCFGFRPTDVLIAFHSLGEEAVGCVCWLVRVGKGCHMMQWTWLFSILFMWGLHQWIQHNDPFDQFQTLQPLQFQKVIECTCTWNEKEVLQSCMRKYVAITVDQGEGCYDYRCCCSLHWCVCVLIS